MPLLGSLIKNAIELSGYQKPPEINGPQAQRKVLKKLLRKAKNTSFGKKFGFSEILDSKNFISEFQKRVPNYDYDSIHDEWWYKAQLGEEDICWPGKINYFALSSGTSGASSKYIPVSSHMVRQIKKISVRELLTLAQYDLPKEFFTKGALMLGGSTQLKYNGVYFEGDLSGISTGKIPLWFQRFYYPGKKISKERDWQTKLNEIVKSAKDWDVAAIVGVPAWFQILMQQIIEYYNLETIHDIWPNLKVFVHGGVSFKPYKVGFEKLLAHPLIYIETYLSSEGFLALQTRPNIDSMQLVLDNGIFFEFVPFNKDNFDSSGNIINNPTALTLDQVNEDEVYAILISTCAGAWRYLIGDTVKFTNLERSEIQIVGRTKHYMNVCGEHLSQANMNRAIELMGQELGVNVKEFSVAGIKHESMFAHQWYIGTDDKLDPKQAIEAIDKYLKELNDDYSVERIAAICEVFVEVLPSKVFYDYMELLGKTGGSFKFPRVLRDKQLADWNEYLNKIKTSN
ncbi:GH3 auxin-responsive promoter family protein [Bacteroidales bacterium OttesenSCG-928-K22]|nr:GH3 auxin-responsive promoter family protein [Bacteroidales bacterium OttesenSCG-928-L14]MDL2240613.1 GH3 auxin-responsive promoter family protein [Bacteroidales bacterium OttesenSCG-928-K22]